MKATFFILGIVAEQHPELVQDIHKAGHEIASHGYGHELVYELTETQFRQDLLRSMRILEEITGGANPRLSRPQLFDCSKDSLGA